jgi:hypothetical protein
MQWNRKEWFISACGGVLIAVACAGLSGLGQDWAGMLFLPGALLAALIFPEGIHGDSPTLYMIAAFVLTTAIVTSSSRSDNFGGLDVKRRARISEL